MADGFDGSEEVFHGLESDAAFAEVSASYYFGLQFVGWPEEEMFTHSDLAAGTDEALPFIGILSNLAGKQDFDTGTEKITRCRVAGAQRLGFKPGPAPVESRGKHARVVEDDQVVGPEQFREIAEIAISAASLEALDKQEAGGCAIGQRLLRNQCLGEVIVKVGDEHAI